MTPRAISLLGIAILFSLLGCRDDHEQVWKQHVHVLKDVHSTLQGVKDEETAKAAAEKLSKSLDELEEIKDRAEDLDAISEADNEALEKKYQPQVDELSARIRSRLETVMQNPQVEQHLKEVRRRMADIAGVKEKPVKKEENEKKPPAEKGPQQPPALPM